MQFGVPATVVLLGMWALSSDVLLVNYPGATMAATVCTTGPPKSAVRSHCQIVLFFLNRTVRLKWGLFAQRQRASQASNALSPDASAMRPGT